MGRTVYAIPSINVPFVTEGGKVHPIWYEFLRSFISDTIESGDDTEVASATLTAGAGLTGGGNMASDITVNVGAGEGITVNADDINVDIDNQETVNPALADGLLISDASDLGSIKKATVQSVVDLANSTVGGSNTQVQYNNGGVLGGDSGMTTDGAGSVNISGDLDVDNLNLNGNTITSTNTNGDITVAPNGSGITNLSSHVKMSDANDVFYWNGGSTSAYHFGSTGGAPYIRGADTNNHLDTVSTGFDWEVGNNRFIRLRNTGRFMYLDGDIGFHRSINTGITASTTQSQGQQPLTREVNEVSTCANVDDVVTLPSPAAAAYCLVINNGANQLQVFPPTSTDLGAGTNNSMTIAAGGNQVFVAYDGTNWVQL